jgi:hypothetical protein
MIVRVLTATVRAENAAAFNARLRQQLPLLREQPGLRYVKLARRMGPTAEDVLLFEEWADTTALYRWAGPIITKPRLLPGTEGLVERVQVDHYEALDMDIEESAGESA